MSTRIQKTGKEFDAAIGVARTPAKKVVWWGANQVIGGNITTLGSGNNRFGVVDDILSLTTLGSLNNYTSGNVDLSGLVNLTTINLAIQGISSLSAIGCSSLTHVDCHYNSSLTSIDLTGCTSLIDLNAYQTSFYSINLSNFSSLTNVRVYDNGNLEYLNLENSSVAGVFCNSCTSLSTLNLNGCTSLAGLYAESCTSLPDVLDLSTNISLVQLRLRSASVKSIIFPQQNIPIQSLKVEFSQITSIDFRWLKNISTFTAYNSNLVSVSNTQNLTNITNFSCSNSNLSGYIDVRGCGKLDNFYLYNCNINGINVEGCTGLNFFRLDGNPNFNAPILGLEDFPNPPFSAFLYVNNCNIDSANLISIANSLPVVTGGNKTFRFHDNPGTASAKSTVIPIASGKGWTPIPAV